MKKIIKIRIILWGTLGFVVLWLLWRAIVPGGEIVYVQDFDDYSYFIPKLTPAERVETGESSVKIVGDPVYFSLRTPRTFNKARLEIKFRASDNIQIMEAGPLMDKTIWRYNLQPLLNNTLDQLSLAWDRVEENGTILLQRDKQYDSPESFLTAPPLLNEIAVYNFDWPREYLLPGYSSSSDRTLINIPLRGAYQFYTYIKDEELNFKFTLADLNQNKDQDNIELILYYRDEIIFIKGIEEANAIENDELVELGEIEFGQGGLPEGVYKIELRVSDDIVTRSIITKQNKIAFINKIRLLRDLKKDIKMYTSVRELNALTPHPDRLQAIKVGQKTLDLSDTYKLISLDIPLALRTNTPAYAKTLADKDDKSTELTLYLDGVTISGNGVFAFKREQMIDPRLKKVDENIDINAEGINYVIATYESPQKDDDWQKASIQVNLKQAYRERGAYQFIISVPGIGEGESVEIDEIRVELKGRTLWEKIREVISKIGNQ